MAGMSFRQLRNKVHQAEMALEAKERTVAADWRQLKGSWKDAWTPGRIILAGLVAGFVIGRAEPLRAAARSGQIMQLITMLSGLFAGGSAQVAAGHAEEAAETAEGVAEAVAPEAIVGGTVASSPTPVQAERPNEPVEP